jgi:hypothetical protein
MIKKTLSLGTLIALGLLGTVQSDCTPSNTPTWWQNFLQDPVEQTQSFEEGVNVVLQSVQVAWGFILPAIPAAQQPAAQQAFLDAVASVTNAEQALLDAAQAIVAAQGGDAGSMANITALMQDVSGAIASVIAIVEQWQNIAHVQYAPGMAQAKAAQQSLQVRFLKDAAAPVVVLVPAPPVAVSAPPPAPTPSAAPVPPPAASSAAPAPSASHAPVTHPAKH